jgi:hypothetical protein
MSHTNAQAVFSLADKQSKKRLGQSFRPLRLHNLHLQWQCCKHHATLKMYQRFWCVLPCTRPIHAAEHQTHTTYSPHISHIYKVTTDTALAQQTACLPVMRYALT